MAVSGDGWMRLKKIAFLTIVLLIPSFVYFIMCPFAHSFSESKSQQLVAFQQHFQKNHVQSKESASPPLWHTSLFPFNLQAYDIIAHALQPTLYQELANRLTLLENTRLNI